MTDFMTVGDLARQLVARRQNADARSEMDTLLEETGSGRRADLSASLRGDFTLLSAIEADLTQLQAFSGTVSELQGRSAAVQRVLSASRQLGSETVAQLLTASPPSTTDTVSIIATEARGRFADFTGRLNASYGGAGLFAGTATDGAAIADSTVILSALEAIVAPLSDASDVEAAVRAWFSAGGDFETVGYLGNPDPLPEVRISPTRQIAIDVTAADPAIRETMIGLALSALSDRAPVLGSLEEQGNLMIAAAEQLQGAQVDLAQLQARIGGKEEELELQQSRNAAEQSALQASRAELTDVDMFETATKLEAVQSRLELLYAITARSAQLSLVRFLG